MITEINLANYYLRKKEIEDAFGEGNDDAGAIKNAIETKVNNVTTKNRENGTAIADIKANSTVKGTIYHPKIHNGLNGVINENGTLNHGSNFTVIQPVINSDGHVTSLTSKTYTLPTQNLSTNDFTDKYKNTLDNLTDIITDTVSNIEIIEIVSELPTNDIKTNKLYLVPNHNGTNLENKFDFYIRVGEDWEQLDGLSFNIGNYITKTEANNTYLKNVSSSVQLSNLNPNVFDTTDGGSNNDKLITSKAVFNGLKNKEDISNRTSTISSSSKDTEYPNAKTIYNTFVKEDSKIKNGHEHNTWTKECGWESSGQYIYCHYNPTVGIGTLKVFLKNRSLTANKRYYLSSNGTLKIYEDNAQKPVIFSNSAKPGYGVPMTIYNNNYDYTAAINTDCSVYFLANKNLTKTELNAYATWRHHPS